MTRELRTERLILRRFVIDDADAMYANWASEDEVTKFLTWPKHADTEVTRAVLESWIQRYKEPDLTGLRRTMQKPIRSPAG